MKITLKHLPNFKQQNQKLKPLTKKGTGANFLIYY